MMKYDNIGLLEEILQHLACIKTLFKNVIFTKSNPNQLVIAGFLNHQQYDKPVQGYKPHPAMHGSPFPNSIRFTYRFFVCQDSTSSCKGVEDSNCGPKACREKIPSREWIHIPPLGKGTSSSNMPIFWGICYSFLEGMSFSMQMK